jgi:hypothetical protein
VVGGTLSGSWNVKAPRLQYGDVRTAKDPFSTSQATPQKTTQAAFWAVARECQTLYSKHNCARVPCRRSAYYIHWQNWLSQRRGYEVDAKRLRACTGLACKAKESATTCCVHCRIRRRYSLQRSTRSQCKAAVSTSMHVAH